MSVNQLETLKSRYIMLAEHHTEEGKLMHEQGNALFKWAVTACMTLNAGALLATINATKINSHSQIWAGIWFLSGVVCSVILAGILAAIFKKAGQESIDYALALKEFARSGDDSELKKLADDDDESVSTFGGMAILGLILTLLFFVVGSAILIEGAG